MIAADPELDALIHLLDDPSETVQQAVRARLEERGRMVLPRLRMAQKSAEEPLYSRLAETMHALHVASVEQAWNTLLEHPSPDLEDGAFLLALFGYPDLDIPAYRAILDDFADQTRSSIEAAHGVERAEVLANFMFNHLGFIGNHETYYDPANSYLNQVIDRRSGIPISLSVIYLLLARRLGLPVHGVNMPAHFVVKYAAGDEEVFLDIFNGGVPFTREAAVRSLKKVGIAPHPRYFRAATTSEILLRMIRNLVLIARDAGDEQTLVDLRRLLDPWDDDAPADPS